MKNFSEQELLLKVNQGLNYCPEPDDPPTIPPPPPDEDPPPGGGRY